jgi:hypothetical protein
LLVFGTLRHCNTNILVVLLPYSSKWRQQHAHSQKLKEWGAEGEPRMAHMYTNALLAVVPRRAPRRMCLVISFKSSSGP